MKMESTQFRLYSSPDLLNPASIIWLEGQGNYTRIHRQGKSSFVTSYTLKRFEEQLTDFVRVRRDILVNPKFVINCWKSGPEPLTLCLVDGTTLQASRRKWRNVIKKLEDGNRRILFSVD
jgi:DNA-binding LytR/AlgR family response regulator